MDKKTKDLTVQCPRCAEFDAQAARTREEMEAKFGSWARCDNGVGFYIKAGTPLTKAQGKAFHKAARHGVLIVSDKTGKRAYRQAP